MIADQPNKLALLNYRLFHLSLEITLSLCLNLVIKFTSGARVSLPF